MSVLAPTSSYSASTAREDEPLVTVWRERITQARESRRPLEKTWLSNLAYASGQHWLVWDQGQRRMRHIQSVDPAYATRELYTADRITEYRAAALGELSTLSEDRPQLLTAGDGDSVEERMQAVNDAVAFGWEYEWNSNRALLEARRLCLDLGTSAIRARFDPSKGPVTRRAPAGQDGQPILDEETLAALEQSGALPDGSLPQFREIHEGQTIWEPLSAFNLLTPPGVPREWDFPWLVVCRPYPLEAIKETYGEAADGLQEDSDIASLMGLSTGDYVPDRQGAVERARLRDHAWLWSCYQMPSGRYPQGRVVTLASNQYRLLRADDELPYQAPDGSRRAGIHFFHWWRMDERFFSRSFIEGLKDPQRILNRRKTQNVEIIDRGMPKVFTKKGSLPEVRGLPLENIELDQQSDPPQYHAGIGPGAWMYEDITRLDEDLAHASTIAPLRLGENPENVVTYSQLQLLHDVENLKRDPITKEHRDSIARLVEDSVWDIRQYWPEEKMIKVAGEGNRIGQQAFQKSQIPDWYVARPAEGSALVRTQAAQLKKIEGVWAAAVASGIATGRPEWVEWFHRSQEAGEPLELPTAEDASSQERMAEIENMLMIEMGEEVVPAYYDLLPVHLPVHRSAEDQARAAGDVEGMARVERHVQASIQIERENALMQASIAPAPPENPENPENTPNSQNPNAQSARTSSGQ